ncbi:hypothetical protein Tco_0906392 [Tanacetum coccineum]|uniref:Uncharacterized protein n=1 Tax=Tanacetum coccineum TaxID=301880 RepID=A0ABQ5CJ30_9ASTR
MEPMPCMRYESPRQLKLALTNYGVAYGKKGNKHRLMLNKVRTGVSNGKHVNKVVKKKVVKYKDVNRKRNYNLGSLVTYKWIALQYCKEIIEDPFIPFRKMKDVIRKKFMIDYRQELLDPNPGSTCRLDVDKSANGSVHFKRMYICFNGVKDGWLAGCRKGLIDVVNDWLPKAEHRKCTRHIHANFKK